MSDVYDVKHFELDYCHEDVSKIVAAIQSKASLLAVGMPGCGKSRLIDFLLHRPDVLEIHGLSNNVKIIRVEGDIVITGPQGMYLELLRALVQDVPAPGSNSLDRLKTQLFTEVGKLETDVDLVVIFDNFSQRLQQTLGEEFFNFLFALRNIRSKLNVSYIFVANLRLDFTGFYKLDRLFDKGIDRSICWLRPLNRKDTFFSIQRQLLKAGHKPDRLGETHLARVYELAGGHALLTRYSTHLMLSGEISRQTEPDQVLKYGGIYTACNAIWRDLALDHQNFLIDVAAGRPAAREAGSPASLLRNYGVLKDQGRLFSLLFESFVKAQKKTRAVIDIQCDEAQTGLMVRTPDKQLSMAIHGLSQRKRRLLCYLIENQDETCAKDQLIQVGWPSDYQQGVSDQALSRQIDGLRSWLKQAEQVGQYIAIETVWGEGYRLVLKD